MVYSSQKRDFRPTAVEKKPDIFFSLPDFFAQHDFVHNAAQIKNGNSYTKSQKISYKVCISAHLLIQIKIFFVIFSNSWDFFFPTGVRTIAYPRSNSRYGQQVHQVQYCTVLYFTKQPFTLLQVTLLHTCWLSQLASLACYVMLIYFG